MKDKKAIAASQHMAEVMSRRTDGICINTLIKVSIVKTTKVCTNSNSALFLTLRRLYVYVDVEGFNPFSEANPLGFKEYIYYSLVYKA